MLRPEQHLGRPIPERHDFVRIGAHRNADGPCQPKVGNLEGAFFVDEQVLGFEVAMEDASRVTKGQSPDELVQV